METLLIDTNVFSFLHKNDPLGDPYQPHLAGKRLALSFMTIAELYRWALVKNWGATKISDLRAKLSQYAVLPYDDLTAWEWARVRNVKGFPVSVDDAWIAAGAIRHNIPLVTHNKRHFEGIPGLSIICERQES